MPTFEDLERRLLARIARAERQKNIILSLIVALTLLSLAGRALGW